MHSELISKYTDRITSVGKIETETQRLSVLDIIHELASEINYISNISFDIVLKNKAVYMLCRFTDIHGYVCKGGVKVENNIEDTLCYLLESISKGQYAIKILNDELSNIQAENGIILTVKYRWGFGKHTSIAYWDYTNIVIRMSEATINNMIENRTDEEIEKYIKSSVTGFKWSDNLPEFIGKYNESELAKLFNSELNYKSITEALQDNMLCQTDIENTIIKNRNTQSSQKLKSVYFVSELGLFAALLLWDIDYDAKTIRVLIMDDKVIDLENSRFVSDHSLFSRIEQKILSDVSDVTREIKE